MNDLALKLGKNAEYFLRKNGPALLTAAGIGGMIAANVLTAKAALKTQDQLKELKVQADEIKSKEDIDDRLRAQELGRHWVVNSWPVVREFAPGVLIGAGAVICLVSSHRMMQNRQTALVAAYAALDTAYKAYRARVREVVGEEAELELYRAPRVLTTEEKVGEGNSLLTCEIDYDERMPSPYARFFDSSCPSWTKTPEYNLIFLRGQQQYFNDRLNAHGFVFLNEVYEALGMERNQLGQHVGWLKAGRSRGDGFIDFGIYDIFDESKRAFVNGFEPVALLDFNVDGPIAI